MTLRVRFDGVAELVTKVLEPVPPGGRWAVNLDDLWPGALGGAMVNAAVFVSCDRGCSAEVARWYEPLSRGVADSGAPVIFQCP